MVGDPPLVLLFLSAVIIIALVAHWTADEDEIDH